MILTFSIFFSLKMFFFTTMLSKFMSKFYKFLIDFFGSLNYFNSSKNSELFLFSLMFFIFILNFCSIFPYNFALSSQIGVILPFSLICYFSLMIFSFSKNFKSQISHFIPEGSPYPLIPFLFLIETVSSLIRPLTLSVRLLANILAGHLLIILLSNLISQMFIFFPLLSLLNMVELCVALIQSYIFSTLVALYQSEI